MAAAKVKIQPPYYPIVYVRGYAMTQGEVEETVATPYMGFNLGSTKIRQDWQGPKTFRAPQQTEEQFCKVCLRPTNHYTE